MDNRKQEYLSRVAGVRELRVRKNKPQKVNKQLKYMFIVLIMKYFILHYDESLYAFGVIPM